MMFMLKFVSYIILS